MCLINNERELRGLLNPWPRPSRLSALLFREVWRHVNCPCPFQLSEGERGRSDVSVARPKHRPKPVRPWLDSPDAKKKYRRRKRKRPPPPPPPPPPRTAERDSRGEKHQYNLSSDQYSHCPRRCVCFFLYTLFRLFCFDGGLLCNCFGVFFLIAGRLTRDITLQVLIVTFSCPRCVRVSVSFSRLCVFFYYGQYSYSDGLTASPARVLWESTEQFLQRPTAMEYFDENIFARK